MAAKKEPVRIHWMVMPIADPDRADSYYTATAKEAAEAWIEEHKYDIGDYEERIGLITVEGKITHVATREQWTIEEVTE